MSAVGFATSGARVDGVSCLSHQELKLQWQAFLHAARTQLLTLGELLAAQAQLLEASGAWPFEASPEAVAALKALAPKPPLGRAQRFACGRVLASLRGNRTQADIADTAGFDWSTMSRYETGRQLPRPRNRARLLAALGCSPEEFEQKVWEQYRLELGIKPSHAPTEGTP